MSSALDIEEVMVPAKCVCELKGVIGYDICADYSQCPCTNLDCDQCDNCSHDEACHAPPSTTARKDSE
jgi:hypothetical protein